MGRSVRVAFTILAAVTSIATEGSSRIRASSNPEHLIAFGIKANGVSASGSEAGGASASPAWKVDGDAATIRVYTRPRALCSLSVDFSGEPLSEPPAVLWTFEAQLVSHDDDSAVVDLRSRREVNDGSVGLSPVAERHRRLFLFEGQPIPLEYTMLDQSRTPDCDGYSIVGSMFFMDPPETRDTRLAYDMWLIYTDARGNETTQRIESQAGQGRTAEYGFSPLWFDATGQMSPTGPIGLAISGTIKGRLLVDGTVHVNIGAVRMVRDRMGSGSAQAGGKSTTIGLGETIEVQLPPDSGTVTPFGSMSPPFNGARMAVRVTPRRIA
jgi:hypothetical protein